eukprot:GEZU01017313.1.p2 GENE.GEZU01017313.1~~GEZU01017313.1.p2  ORF type:complete len:100 (-),score=9.69 GEZU01017313.1:952-1251(-)
MSAPLRTFRSSGVRFLRNCWPHSSKIQQLPNGEGLALVLQHLALSHRAFEHNLDHRQRLKMMRTALSFEVVPALTAKYLDGLIYSKKASAGHTLNDFTH